MYQYDQYDQTLVNERVNQFRSQTERFLAGKLTDEQFLPLRLQNGLYIQRQAPMLRIAIPYGMLSSKQLDKLADITDQFDKGYGHISTRQNMQLNWVELAQVPDILAELATVEMHAIQTSGNCIRNVTTDHFAGITIDETEDPRPWCEVLRQWSTLHPEFAFLPRKFKIAVNANPNIDRAAIKFHDIGLQLVHNDKGETGFQVFVGGGLGRTPLIGEKISDFVPGLQILGYLESVLRVYNLNGRRDNKYKARIKILVKALGIDKFRELVNQDYSESNPESLAIPETELARIKACFKSPDYQQNSDSVAMWKAERELSPVFSRWLSNNTHSHKQPGYAAVTISLKPTGVPPGDITSEQMRLLAKLADRYSLGELRTTHYQNIVLPDVRISNLYALWQELEALNLAAPNHSTLNDMICCPGGDFCALANARSIPIAESVQQRFDNPEVLESLGHIRLNISGCMNACGHHHIGDIGILGVDKKGEEFYQVSLGGSSEKRASLGKILGPSFKAEQMPDVIEKIIATYLDNRQENEGFGDVVVRLGPAPFKERVYAKETV